jgi:hypothetical protein
MTPKKKAEELVGKYYVTIYHSIHQQQKAKECALIVVDEILLMVNETLKGFLDGDIILYWLQVKQEVEKL